MGYKIGIDFGTTNTIISFMKDDKLEPFFYGGVGRPGIREYLPSCIAYDKNGDCVVGGLAIERMRNSPHTTFYENFKMLLPTKNKDDWKKCGWPNTITPIEATRKYFEKLLIDKKGTCFKREIGEIDGVVISIPQFWYKKSLANPGAVNLSRIIKEDLGLPLIRLISEPVAATMFCAYEHKRAVKKPLQGNILVCDMGGGTFDVSLCSIKENSRVEVLEFDGNGQKGIGAAGVYFDKEVVKRAYEKAEGKEIDQNSTEFFDLLKAFEELKISMSIQGTTRNRIFQVEQVASYKQTLDIYTFCRNYKVFYDMLIEAFKPVKEGINRVLSVIKKYLKNNEISFDHLIIVGGFGQYYLVQRAILDFWGIPFTGDPRFNSRLNTQNGLFAISYGASLLANDKIPYPLEKYMHSHGIFAHREEPGKLIKTKYEIISAGSPVDDFLTGQFAKYLGEEVGFRVNTIDGKIPSIEYYMDYEGKGDIIKQELNHVRLPDDMLSKRHYKVGLLLDKSNLAYLIIEDSDGNRLQKEIGEAFPSLLQKSAGDN